MDFAGALFAVGHKRFEFRALGLCKVYFPATRWHTPSWWSEYTKILQLSKDLLEKPLSRAVHSARGDCHERAMQHRTAPHACLREDGRHVGWVWGKGHRVQPGSSLIP